MHPVWEKYGARDKIFILQLYNTNWQRETEQLTTLESRNLNRDNHTLWANDSNIGTSIALINELSDSTYQIEALGKYQTERNYFRKISIKMIK